MSDLNKPYSFYTLFREPFPVSRRELGRNPDQSLTGEAKTRFLDEKVEVRVAEVVVPKIQRDYAQGRANEKEVRENFLQALYDALVDVSGRKRCSLNFIYGHFLDSKEKAGAVSFVPYDGQQRLTTLYLLYWYASRKDHALEDFLRGFRYDTRFSSTTFTTMFLAGIKSLDLSQAEAEWLTGKNVQDAEAGQIVPVGEMNGRGVFSRWLMNKNGFAGSWMDDPTVNGMLEMLDAIHVKFHGMSGLWQRLCEEDAARLPVYFYFQKVSRTLDAGSIFIKMNSRGKLLTEFECFKADFLRLLRKGQYPDDKRDAIAKKIDRVWEQSFWELAMRQGLKETDTDVLLMRYVNFVIDLIGFEKNMFQSRNARMHLYDSERLKKIVLSPEGTLREAVIQDLEFAVDTWCGGKQEDRPDEYFQTIFSREGNGYTEGSIKLFFKPDPGEFFTTIILGKELTLNAVALFHAVLVARQKSLSAAERELRLRSVRNLVYFMDKGIAELPYILQKVRLLMEDGLSVDFSNETSQRKFTDTQIQEERFKEWLSVKDVNWYGEIRKAEESDWFKGQIGALLPEVMAALEERERVSLLNGVFAKRLALFKRLFCSGNVPDSLIRKALFCVEDNGCRYWVSSKGWYWVGASTDDFAWKAARPYFTREGNPQAALRKLLDHPYFDTVEGAGRGLLESFVNCPESCFKNTHGPFDVRYYLRRYYDEFFERWAENEKGGHDRCVGRILPDASGLIMQMLDGKTRSSPYWDPYLYVSLKQVDPNSIKLNGQGAFSAKDLIRQYGAWDGCWLTHRNSHSKIWNAPYGVSIRSAKNVFAIIKPELDTLNIETELLEQSDKDEDVGTWLLRTRAADDKQYMDRVDRIEICKRLLTILMKSSVQYTHSA